MTDLSERALESVVTLLEALSREDRMRLVSQLELTKVEIERLIDELQKRLMTGAYKEETDDQRSTISGSSWETSDLSESP
jgi:DNA replicative helicase MCM subunit Mcm2 (Cdc46/Mcm family)